MRYLVFLLLLLPVITPASPAGVSTPEQQRLEIIDNLEEPLYNPFVERYVLDELKSLRTDMQEQRTDFATRLAATELGASDRAVNYATRTINNIFYIIEQ